MREQTVFAPPRPRTLRRCWHAGQGSHRPACNGERQWPDGL